MVESEANELSEDEMLGAVMFGHEQIQPVIDAIIELAEKRRQGAVRLRSPPTTRRCTTPVQAAGEAELRAAYAITDKQERDGRGRPRAKDAGHRRARREDAARRRRTLGTALQEAREATIVRGDDPQDRQAHRRPRHSTTVRPIVVGSRRAAAHPRLGAVHPRRDPGAGRRPRSAPATTSRSSTRSTATYARSASCCTTTSRPSRSARRGRIGGRRAAARSATASWPSARSQPVLPAHDDFPYTIRIVSEITESNGSSSMATVCGALAVA